MLTCLSLSHRTAGFALLERLPDAPEARRIASELPQVRGIVPVATCNRLELYLDLTGDVASPEEPLSVLLDALATHSKLPVSDLTDAARTMSGTRVAAHLFAVASGLDSVVLGENEIAGQVRRSLESAHDDGTTTPALQHLFQSASTTSRGVKNVTGINSAGRSLVRLALDLAESRLAPWSQANVLLIGTGSYAAATWTALAERGVSELNVASPSGREQVFAQRHGATPVGAARLRRALAAADLVITSTRSQALTAEALRKARDGVAHPLLVIDLGLPANVEKQAGALHGVELLDLETISLHAPVTEVDTGTKARELVEAAANDFARSSAVRTAGPAIAAYRGRVDAVLESELERLADRGALTPETERALRHFAGVLVHEPTTRIRSLAAEGRLAEATAALEALYDLEPHRTESRRAAGPERMSS